MAARLRLLLVYPSTYDPGWVRRFQLPPLSLKQVAAATPDEWDVVLADEIHENVPFQQFQQEKCLLHTNWKRYDHGQVVFRPKQMTPERLYRGWKEARREAYRWPTILSRVMEGPGRMTNLAYNVLRRGGIYGRDQSKEAGGRIADGDG